MKTLLIRERNMLMKIPRNKGFMITRSEKHMDIFKMRQQKKNLHNEAPRRTSFTMKESRGYQHYDEAKEKFAQ
ncbi:hypothetical protein C922_05000 [Plasmodium inui San Antonio 1]|uniref:Uncharacterized protein n=1 Tax=Plasmodium inui San Antonio 1 TaxID=1237626 RepID=W6ZZ85_9APIC|nr:hypothetical protein C922_05000 [Plasmodium inui San Antonio 1]EUD64585.1 hypothetical protein C922_05000 [Plasmodium inui San Antonio 1]